MILIAIDFPLIQFVHFIHWMNEKLKEKTFKASETITARDVGSYLEVGEEVVMWGRGTIYPLLI